MSASQSPASPMLDPLNRLWRPLRQAAAQLAEAVSIGLESLLGFVFSVRRWEFYWLRRGLVVLPLALLWALAIVYEADSIEFMLDRLMNALTTSQPLLPLAGWAKQYLFSAAVLRHLIPAGAGILLAVEAAALYLRDLFELEDVGTARRYLVAAAFGIGLDTIEIKDGQIVEEHRGHPVAKIGGPGHIKVHLGNVAVLEKVNGSVETIGPAEGHFIEGFERVREVVNLRDQVGAQDNVRALTKDGILVTARDVKMVFHVRANVPRSPENPYPYDPAAIRQLVYGKSVGPDGLGTWERSLPGSVAGIIRNYIAAHTLDGLIESANGGDTPREILTDSLYTPAAMQRVRDMGLELIWVGVGTWETPEAVSHQHIQAWQEQWLHKIHASAEYLDGVERGARAKAVNRILNSLDTLWLSIQPVTPGDKIKATHLRFRVIETLKGIRSTPDVPGQLPPDFETAIEFLERL